MSSPEYSWKVKLLKKFTIPTDKLKYLKTLCGLLQEVKDFKWKETQYQGLVSYMETSRPTMRTLTLYKGIEAKYNIVEARECFFTAKFWKVLDEEEKICAWVEPLLNGSDDYDYASKTLSVEERKEIMRKFVEAAKAMSEMITEFSKLKQEWDEIEGEMNDVIDHCIKQVQTLIAENATGRRR
ncbi:unnamed protein product [Orchesella dallaii]|uniref:Uncharacterized protein n=1 Tax=Orchesella dallaii TaxID=48710 RepID=A0ABP1QLW9_9HEXA